MFISSYKQANIWFEQSYWDLECAKLSMSNAFYEWSCFEAQQAAEKAIKAAIVANGEKAPRTHKLSSLIGLIKDCDNRIRKFYFDIRTLQAFTFVSRYPFLIPEENKSPHNFITFNDAQKCINQAETVLKTLQNFYKN